MSGHSGKTAAGLWFGSVQASVPLVQPDAPTSPLAFDQPPEYQAQSTFLADSRSPIVGLVSGGSRRASAVFGANGWKNGCVVLTAKSPHTTPVGVAGRGDGGLHDAVSIESRGPVGLAVPPFAPSGLV